MEDFKFATAPMVAIEQKLVSFTDMERKGYIELRPIRQRKSTEGRVINHTNYSFRCYKDYSTGTTYGIPIGKNPDGTYKFQRITINGHRFYNLENEQDAREWHIVKNCPRIKGSMFPSGDPLFAVINQEKEAEDVISKFSESRKAGDYIMGLEGNKLVEFSRLFGFNPETNSPSVLKKLLLEMAQRNPVHVTDKMANRIDTAVNVVIKRAMSVGLIKNTMDKGYMFKDGIPLGLTEPGMVEFLKKDSLMLSSIDAESKRLDKFYKDAPIANIEAPAPKQAVHASNEGDPFDLR